MEVDIKVEGLQDVQKKLYSYSQKLGDTVILKALRLGANVIKKSIQGKAPVRTGRVKRGIVVKKSRINNGKAGNPIGLYITLRNGKGKKDPKDAFYGRFQEDGWNTRGKQKGARQQIVEAFGSRSGRKTQPGKTNVPGKKFIKGGFESSAQAAARLTIAASQEGAELLQKKLGMK